MRTSSAITPKSSLGWATGKRFAISVLVRAGSYFSNFRIAFSRDSMGLTSAPARL